MGVIPPTPARMTRMSTSPFESDLDARAQRFDRTLAVGFDDEVERLLTAVGRHLHERFERDALDPTSRRCERRAVWSCVSRRLRAPRVRRETTISVSPAAGTSERPMISTGIDGPAFLTCLPLSSMSARILPYAAPTTTTSPTRSVPFCTSTVATAPRPRSSADSMTTPVARRFLLALSSLMSASSSTVSSS